MLQYLRLIAIYGFILFCLGFIVVKSHAQTSPGFEARNSIATTAIVALCFAGGAMWPARNGICFSVDANRAVLPTNGVTISNAPRPSCENGWTLVDAGRPMCARELREPR